MQQQQLQWQQQLQQLLAAAKQITQMTAPITTAKMFILANQNQ